MLSEINIEDFSKSFLTRHCVVVIIDVAVVVVVDVSCLVFLF